MGQKDIPGFHSFWCLWLRRPHHRASGHLERPHQNSEIFLPVRLAKSRKEKAKNWKLSQAVGGLSNWINCFGKKLLANMKIHTPHDLAIAPLDAYTQRSSDNVSRMIQTTVSSIYNNSKPHIFIQSRETVLKLHISTIKDLESYHELSKRNSRPISNDSLRTQNVLCVYIIYTPSYFNKHTSHSKTWTWNGGVQTESTRAVLSRESVKKTEITMGDMRISNITVAF